MFVIGMMVFTAGASTPKLEHKQKTEVVKQFTLQTTTAVSVEKLLFNSSTFCPGTLQNANFKVVNFEALKSANTIMFIDDVGWYSCNRNINYIQSEFLLPDYKTLHPRIRDLPNKR